MTCGIYRLVFYGTEKTYIGQSVNIEKRFKQHCASLLNNQATGKLQIAYFEHGLPSLDILIECPTEFLDINESEAIAIFNSVNNGYNTYLDANQAPTYSGHGYGNSKYSKEDVITAVQLLIQYPEKSYADISEESGIHIDTVQKLAKADTHQWLWDEYPKLYQSIISIKNSRTRASSSDKLSAKAKGIVYPSIKSPTGEIYSIDNAYKFAKAHGLAPNHFQEVLNRHRKSHKGWKLA